MRYNQQNRGFGAPGFQFGPGTISQFIKYIIGINLVVFIFQNFNPSLNYILGFTPERFFSEFPNLLYQPFSYMFLHGDFGHIFFNMLMLWMFGTEIELTWGTKRFAKFYIIGGISGAILTMMVLPGQNIPVIGASAAVYSIFVAYWFMFPNRQLLLFFVLPVKVKWAIPAMMLIGFIFGGNDIAHFAHLGGAVFGFIYMKSDWKFLSFSNKYKQFKYKRKQAKFEKNREKAEAVMKKVDDVLDRINEVGFENLTKEEKKILEEASNDLSNQDKSK